MVIENKHSVYQWEEGRGKCRGKEVQTIMYKINALRTYFKAHNIL